MEVFIITPFPDSINVLIENNIANQGIKKRLLNLEVVNLRDFTSDNYKKIDDEPYGGGAGMIMRPDVLGRAFDENNPGREWKKIILTPRGKPLTQKKVREISSKPGVIIVCGRYEGIDERFISSRSLDEVCIGDYVLSGGEPAALILIDAIVRLLTGTMGSKESLIEESFENNLLEYPQYTRPFDWEGMKPPEVLLSGNHSEIEKWRRYMALEDTKKRRPELLISEKK